MNTRFSIGDRVGFFSFEVLEGVVRFGWNECEVTAISVSRQQLINYALSRVDGVKMKYVFVEESRIFSADENGAEKLGGIVRALEDAKVPVAEDPSPEIERSGVQIEEIGALEV